MTRTTLALVVALGVLLVPFAIAPTLSAGAHPPVPLCGGCTDGFETAAADHGTNATVQHSELELHVRENASVTGVAMLRVDERTADRFHENTSLLDVVAGDAFVTPEGSDRSRWAADAPVRGVEDVRASIDDRTVTVRFRVPNAADAAVGDVVYSDLLKRNSTVGRVELAVDAFRFVGPEGTAVTRAPDGSVDGATASWNPSDGERIGYGGYVAWSDGGVAGTVATEASLWLGEASTEYPRLATASGLAVVIAVALGAFLVVAAPRFDERPTPTTGRLAVAYAVVAVAAVVAAATLVVWRVEGVGFAAFALVPGSAVAAGLVAGLALLTDDTAGTIARLPTTALYALPVLAGLTLVVGVASPGNAALWAASAGVVLVGALGVASARGLLPSAAVVLAFALLPATVGFPALSPSNFESPNVVVWVVLVVLAGVPLFAFGRASERRASPSRDGERRTSESDSTDQSGRVNREDADAQR